ncbi:DUF4376 domain-containing protein, partial [Escherichia coli]
PRQQLDELLTAMVQAQVDRNDEVCQRQREMKEEQHNQDDLRSIREMAISGNHAR